jgi:hypothetical protein
VIELLWVYSNEPQEWVVTRTHTEIDAMLDKIAALSREDWAAAAQVTEAGVDPVADFNAPEMYVGFHVDRGALLYVGPDDPDGSFSVGDRNAPGEPILYMLGLHDTEFPSNAEIAADVVRRAAHEFADTGERPTDLRWRPIRGDAWSV